MTKNPRPSMAKIEIATGRRHDAGPQVERAGPLATSMATAARC
jgi:hypothetical protein